VSPSTVAPLGGPGLTVAWLFDALPDRELRRFLDPGALSVLDAIFGGRIAGEDLRRVARTLVDFDVLLGERAGRRRVLNLIPERKRAELEARVGRTIAAAGASDWTESEVRRLRDFFGLVEERIVPPTVPSTSTITPAYSLFDHQRNAVRKLAPLLAEDERRARGRGGVRPVDEPDLEDHMTGHAQHEHPAGVAPLELPERRRPAHREEEDERCRDEARQVEGVGVTQPDAELDDAEAGRPGEDDHPGRRFGAAETRRRGSAGAADGSHPIALPSQETGARTGR